MYILHYRITSTFTAFCCIKTEFETLIVVSKTKRKFFLEVDSKINEAKTGRYLVLIRVFIFHCMDHNS